MRNRILAASLLFATAASASVLINGAGATFPFPLYSKWFADFNRLHPDLKFNYQSIESGGGVKQITEGTVDFGASDAPMTDEELKKAPDVVHLPTVLGAVVVVYNLPGVSELKLSPGALVGILSGKISRWNDAALSKDNPGTRLPDTAITVAHRSDGSGTTAIFTDYLAKVSPEWKSQVGAGKSVRWPVGLGGKGNEGVTGIVKQTPGAVGYVELAYAHQNKLSTAAIRNKDGAFVLPSIASTSAAAAKVQMPADFRVSVTDAEGKEAYPISGFTYLLIRRDQKDKERGTAMVRFLAWALGPGQTIAPGLDYAPLPPPVLEKARAALKALTVQGRPVDGAGS